MNPEVLKYQLVIDVTAIHQQSGGAGTYVRALVSALGQLGHPPILIARRNDTYEWDGASSVHRVAPVLRPVRLVWEHAALGRLVAKLIPSGTVVLHSPHYTTPAWLPRRICRTVTIHDLTFFSRPYDHAFSKRVLFRRAITVSAAKADAIVAVSATTAAHYESITGRSDRVFCAPHGVDRQRFKPRGQLTPDELHSDQNLLEQACVSGRVIVCLGTIEPRKQIPQLLRAYQHVRAQLPDVGLVLAGQQWPGMSLPAAQPGELRLGYVSDQLAAALLRTATVVAYPSAEEGFGMPLVEAMACGAALVAARSEVSVEVCGDVGELVELNPTDTFSRRLGAALIDVLNNPLSFRSGGIERSEQFSWKASAEVHLRAYLAAANRAESGRWLR